MDTSAAVLIRICDVNRKKSLVKCAPTIRAVLSKGNIKKKHVKICTGTRAGVKTTTYAENLVHHAAMSMSKIHVSTNNCARPEEIFNITYITLITIFININNFILAGQAFFNKNVSHIVLEKDGFMIGEDEVLEICVSEGYTFMLLNESETWINGSEGTPTTKTVSCFQVSIKSKYRRSKSISYAF